MRGRDVVVDAFMHFKVNWSHKSGGDWTEEGEEAWIRGESLDNRQWKNSAPAERESCWKSENLWKFWVFHSFPWLTVKWSQTRFRRKFGHCLKFGKSESFGEHLSSCHEPAQWSVFCLWPGQLPNLISSLFCVHLWSIYHFWLTFTFRLISDTFKFTHFFAILSPRKSVFSVQKGKNGGNGP